MFIFTFPHYAIRSLNDLGAGFLDKGLLSLVTTVKHTEGHLLKERDDEFGK